MSIDLDAMIDEIRRENMNVFSLTLAGEGERRTEILREDSLCRDVYSVSKAFTMAAIGMLCDDGRLSPDDTVGKLFGTLPKGSDERWLDVTVADCLRHRTGITHEMDVDAEYMTGIGDWLAHLFSLPIDGVRGETYTYTDGVYYLLSRIVSLKTGAPMFDFMRERLFNPLGFREYAWSCCPEGYTAGGSGLFISCSDMAKLGELWLNGGKWRGKRVISEEWTRLALENDYALSKRSAAKQGYYKTGAFGQILYFSYADNLVFAMQAYMPSDDRTKLVNDFIKE